MLYTSDANDTAQLWRAMYAEKYGEHTLYWLNCVLGGIAKPFALDRFTGALRNNADVYLAVKSSARDQLLYFTEVDDTGRVYIHLYDKLNSQDNPTDLVLTAAPNPNGMNGDNSPTSLTQAGNVYWSEYADGNPGQRWVVETKIERESPYTIARATDFPYDKYYQNEQNIFYPSFVGECTWYCKGRFLEANGIANCCYGNAYEWETNPLVDASEEVKTLGREVGNPDDITLRDKSVAVFGIGGVYNLGHVVFIKELKDGNVIYSHCNGVRLNNVLGISNGEIEVRNSIAPFDEVQDGYKMSLKEDVFRHNFGNGLRAIIYKL